MSRNVLPSYYSVNETTSFDSINDLKPFQTRRISTIQLDKRCKHSHKYRQRVLRSYQSRKVRKCDSFEHCRIELQSIVRPTIKALQTLKTQSLIFRLRLGGHFGVTSRGLQPQRKPFSPLLKQTAIRRQCTLRISTIANRFYQLINVLYCYYCMHSRIQFNVSFLLIPITSKQGQISHRSSSWQEAQLKTLASYAIMAKHTLVKTLCEETSLFQTSLLYGSTIPHKEDRR